MTNNGPRGDRRISSMAVLALPFAVLGIMLVFSVSVLSDEYIVRRAHAASRVLPADASQTLTQGWASGATSSLPPRAAMFRALVAGRAAFVAIDPAERQRLVASARHDLAVAEAARPVWPEADVVRTYVEFVAGGANAPATRAAFAKSYQGAPFIEESALWRVSYGGNQWNALDAETQAHVIDEALWHRYRSQAKDSVLLPALAGGEAERRYRAAISAAAKPAPTDRPPQS